MRRCTVLFVLAACGGGDPGDLPSSATPDDPRATPLRTPSVEEPRAPEKVEEPRPPDAGALPTGRALYVDNDTATALPLEFGTVKVSVPTGRLALVELPAGSYAVGPHAFAIDPGARRVLVYNPGATGRYEELQQFYQWGKSGEPVVTHRHEGKVLVLADAPLGFGQRFPEIYGADPISGRGSMRRLCKVWPTPTTVEQALAFSETPEELRDRDVALMKACDALFMAHPHHPRVWALALSQVEGKEAAPWAQRVIECRIAADLEASRAALQALPDSPAKRKLLARVAARDDELLRQRLAGGDLDAVLANPRFASSNRRLVSPRFAGRSLTPEEQARIDAAAASATPDNRQALCELFLDAYRGPLPTLACWALAQPSLASRAHAWFLAAAQAGELELALRVVEAPWEPSEGGGGVSKVLATVALSESTDHARRAARALIEAVERLPEPRRFRAIGELHGGLMHHDRRAPGAVAAAAELGAMGARLLGAGEPKVRREASELVVNAIKHTRDRALLATLRRAATSETDAELRRRLEHEVRQLEAVFSKAR